MSKVLVKRIIKAIKVAAKDTGKEPGDVSKLDVLQSDSTISDWELRKVGGLKSIQKKYFPETDKDLATIADAKNHNSYVSRLEKKLGDKQSFEDKLLEVWADSIQPLPKVARAKRKNPKKNALHREVVAMLNDTHVGVIIDGDEIGGLNEFDFIQAGRRFAYFAKEVAEYKPHAREEVRKLHLILNGDMIAGLIHGLDTKGIHLMVHQQNALLHILTHAIAFLSESYDTIEIHGVAGNHDRAVHKNHGKRAVNEVYDSYANLVYYGLSVAFRQNPNISFNFPKTPYGFIDLPGGRAMYAHGDHIFSSSLGNPGSSINVKGISAAIKDFNAGEVAKGNEPIKLLLLGHVHTFSTFITNDGVLVYIAPSLSGTDAFAHSLTINNSFAAQVVFESTPKFILGDSRLVRVTEADKITELDKIIPTYNKELVWKK